MSAWVALRRRIDLRPGQRILVLGATGNAGQLAVQVARHLDASHVVAAGRQPARLGALPALGADVTVSLTGDTADVAHRLGQAAGDADIVIDYLWGQPAANAMRAIITNRADSAPPLTWLQVGSVAGATAAIPSAALRAAPLQILGSGQGSVPTRDILGELPALAAAITAGTFRIDARAVPLADVESAWKDIDSDQRIVITP